MTTLDDLLSPESEDESLSYFLTELAAVGFPTTAWQTGGVAYTLIRVLAKAVSDKLALIRNLAASGFLDLAAGGWLTLLAKSAYTLDRYLATLAQGTIRIAIGASYAPQTVQPGQLWVTDNAGHRYNAVNPAPVAISAGASAVIPFRAESPGSAYNIANGTGLSMVTALPGMTAALEVSGASWLTVQGADDETDANLRARCRARWATVGLNKTRDGFLFLAMNAPGVTTQPNRVYVDDTNPRGPGTCNVWLAGPGGPLPAPDVATIASYLSARQSVCSDVATANAVTRAVDVAATVYYRAAYTGALGDATNRVTAMLQALDLGAPVYLAEVLEQLMGAAGVYNVAGLTLNGGAADLALAVNEVATVGTFTLTGIAAP